jgi:Phage integrase family
LVRSRRIARWIAADLRLQGVLALLEFVDVDGKANHGAAGGGELAHAQPTQARVLAVDAHTVGLALMAHAFDHVGLHGAGLPEIRWHDIRHLWATWHTLNGTPQRVLQALGGWKDERRMVARYATLNVDMAAPWAGNAFGARHTFGTPSKDPVEAPEKNFNADNALAGVADGIRTHNNRNHNPGLYR